MANLSQLRAARKAVKSVGGRLVWAENDIAKFYFPSGRRVNVWYPYPLGRVHDIDEVDMQKVIDAILGGELR